MHSVGAISWLEKCFISAVSASDMPCSSRYVLSFVLIHIFYISYHCIGCSPDQLAWRTIVLARSGGNC